MIAHSRPRCDVPCVPRTASGSDLDVRLGHEDGFWITRFPQTRPWENGSLIVCWCPRPIRPGRCARGSAPREMSFVILGGAGRSLLTPPKVFAPPLYSRYPFCGTLKERGFYREHFRHMLVIIGRTPNRFDSPGDFA